MNNSVTFFEVSYVANPDSAPALRNGEHATAVRRFASHAAATAFASGVRTQKYIGHTLRLVPATVACLRGDLVCLADLSHPGCCDCSACTSEPDRCEDAEEADRRRQARIDADADERRVLR